MASLLPSPKLARILAARRKLKDLTLEALGKKIGVKKGYLSMLENGKCAPPLPHVVLKLSKALEVGARDLAFVAHMDGAPKLVTESESYPAVALEVKAIADRMIGGGNRVVRGDGE